MSEEKLEPRLEVISQIKKKSNISRLESGKYNPSLDLLIRVAGCLGKRIHIWME